MYCMTHNLYVFMMSTITCIHVTVDIISIYNHPCSPCSYYNS